MSEPTREQIKEAFKKTIERWEKIVEDVDYHDESKCSLCLLFPGYSGSCNQNVCPVGVFTESFGCNCTPYHTFNEDKTPENALAELNFLRKVYIWWMEKEANKIWEKYGMDKPKKEEKKEEWEDITKKIKWREATSVEDFNILWGDYGERTLVYIGQCGLEKNDSGDDSIKFETLGGNYGLSGHAFRILKKT